MTIISQDKCLVLIIDVQEKLLRAAFNPETVQKNSVILSKAASILNLPVFITEQYPKGLGGTIEGISGKTYEKTSFNALEDKNLLNELKETNRKQVILFGIETHICVHQTAAALIEAGFEVTVISDACSSRTLENHLAGLECMKENGAHIKTSEIVLFEILKGANHPNFKEIQALIK